MKPNTNNAAPGKQSTPKRNRRRKYIINPAFQWKYISLVGGGVFVASCLMSTVLYGMVYYQARERLLHLTQSQPLENTYGILIFAGAFALLMAAGFAVWTAILTHRIGGPIHVMMNYFADLSNSKIPKVRPLRAKDELKSFHDSFRRAADSLRCDREAEIKMIDEVLELANQAGATSDARPDSMTELVSKLQSLHLHLANSIGADAKSASQGAASTSEKDAPVTA
ncbi:MAG: hypothetical protein DHS20C16_28530 [Phycisphaerae bacterium]|nr:MAG: hypothetical protein DHS20C16_28530 [Phycisphaerae bacterium]